MKINKHVMTNMVVWFFAITLETNGVWEHSHLYFDFYNFSVLAASDNGVSIL